MAKFTASKWSSRALLHALPRQHPYLKHTKSSTESTCDKGQLRTVSQPESLDTVWSSCMKSHYNHNNWDRCVSVPRKAEPQPQITALAFHMSLDNHLIWLPLVITFHGVVIGFWASMWLRSKCCYNTEMACNSLVWPVRLYSWNLWGRPVNRAYCCTSHRCSVRPFEG